MSNTIIDSIYKHNNNKYHLINITIICIFRQKNKREKKNHINLYFFRALHGLPTSLLYFGSTIITK